MHPMLVIPDPSPPVGASDTVPGDDELLQACLQSMQSKHASLATETALLQGNVIVQAPHTSTTEQGDPSNHIQPMHETVLTKIYSRLHCKRFLPPFHPVPPQG
jgi:hypothetical protein